MTWRRIILAALSKPVAKLPLLEWRERRRGNWATTLVSDGERSWAQTHAVFRGVRVSGHAEDVDVELGESVLHLGHGLTELRPRVVRPGDPLRIRFDGDGRVSLLGYEFPSWLLPLVEKLVARRQS